MSRPPSYSISWVYYGDGGPSWAEPRYSESAEPLAKFSYNDGVTTAADREPTLVTTSARARKAEVRQMLRHIVEHHTNRPATEAELDAIAVEPASPTLPGSKLGSGHTAGGITAARLDEVIAGVSGQGAPVQAALL